MTSNHPGSVLSEQVRSAARETREETLRLADLMKDRFTKAAAECKHTLAERVLHVGDALHGAADRLRTDGDPSIADGIDAAASRVEHASDFLDRADFDTIRQETTEFTRRHPQWVYGGLFLTGLAIARILRASSEDGDARSRSVSSFQEEDDMGFASPSAESLSEPVPNV